VLKSRWTSLGVALLPLFPNSVLFCLRNLKSRIDQNKSVLKKDSGAAILLGIVLTLVILNLLLLALSFDVADMVGGSVGAVIAWTFAWWSVRRRSNPQQTSQAT
jgi:hypothetical protein